MTFRPWVMPCVLFLFAFSCGNVEKVSPDKQVFYKSVPEGALSFYCWLNESLPEIAVMEVCADVRDPNNNISLHIIAELSQSGLEARELAYASFDSVGNKVEAKFRYQELDSIFKTFDANQRFWMIEKDSGEYEIGIQLERFCADVKFIEFK